MIGIPQGRQRRLPLLADDHRIHIHGHIHISLLSEAPQDTPGPYRDASGCCKDTLDGYTDLAEMPRMGSWIFISLADVRLSIRDIYDNIKVSWWEAVITGYLDPNAYKKGKATSQIELRSQIGQT